MVQQALKKSLGDVLIEENLLNRSQLLEAVSEQKKTRRPLVSILINKGFVSEENIVVTLSELLGIPHVRLSQYQISPEVLSSIPDLIVRQHHLIPVSKTANTLTVAMSDPLNIIALDDIKLTTGYETIEVMVSLYSEITEAIEKYYGTVVKKDDATPQEDLEEILKDFQSGAVQTVEATIEEIDLRQLKEEIEQAPVIRLVNLILLNALRSRASDIHIEPFEKEVRIRNRIDGMLHEAPSPPKTLKAALVSRIKVISELDIAERRVPQDGRFRIRFENRDIDFRVSTLPTYYGEKVVMRILDRASLTLDLTKLGFEEKALNDFIESISRPHGIVLVTGPTGSGKTTTLYSALHRLNKPDVNIVTAEDPIEYELHGINQVQVRPEVGLTFAGGLRSILRQDPDIVMVGEIRDEETADIAIKAALTGHLVLSTLHTNDAPGAITRLMDMGIEPFLISSSLLLAAAQRLLRKVCPSCKEPYAPSKEMLESLHISPKKDQKITFYKGKGCPTCNNSGYKGRMAILETLPISEKIRELIAARASADKIKKTAIEVGMQTLWDCSVLKVLNGITTIEEALRVTASD